MPRAISPVRVAVWGVNGKMGQVLREVIDATPDFVISFGVDRSPDKIKNPFPVSTVPSAGPASIDLIIDFSHPDSLSAVLYYASEHRLPTLIATTGMSAEHYAMIEQAGKIVPVLHCANTSFGIAIINKILREYAKQLSDGFDIEIIEKHHRHKIDAPSGTAKLFAATIQQASAKVADLMHGREGQCGPRRQEELGIHSVRGGTITGEHTIVFAGEQETVEIKHTAMSKMLFAQDALRLARRLINLPNGVYTAEELYFKTYS